MSFQKISEPNARIYSKVFGTLLNEENTDSILLNDWFEKYGLFLPGLSISISEKPTKKASCPNFENSFLRVLDNITTDYGKGIILINQDTPFGIIKGAGQLAQFFSAYNLVDSEGKIKTLRGGVYRANKELYTLINHINLKNRQFKILNVDRLNLSLDRMLIEDNFHYSSAKVADNLDKVLLGASNYLNTKQGDYEIIFQNHR